MVETIDLTGQKINNLTVLFMEPRQPNEPKKWRCRCDCGNETTVWQADLRRARTRSCGCALIGKNVRHGATAKQTQGAFAAEYRCWVQMRNRCGPNPKGRGWLERYFERGIRVCERWDDFSNFLADMGPRPSPKHSLDRVDNDGNYEPGNCRWATKLEQSNNLECTIYAQFQGEWVPVAELARRTGIARHIVHRWAIGEHRARGTILEGVKPRYRQKAKKNMKRKAA